MEAGIVGLPNVGKSTLFNALTAAGIASENYPFCTIEPNIGAVAVPDGRLTSINQFMPTEKIIPAMLQLVDIAGLVRGASQGEGLGNKFLSHIKGVDAILHVVRCFEDPDVTHVDGKVDPVRDIETLDTELLLTDLQSVEGIATRAIRNARSGDKEAKMRVEIAALCQETLDAARPLRQLKWDDPLMAREFSLLQFLTAKPVLYVANVDEDDPKGESPLVDVVRKHALAEGGEIVVVCGKLEAELAELSTEDQHDLLESVGLEEPALAVLARATYRTLGLQSFFTAGPKEIRAWTVRQGACAPEAAGVIHSDFERGFIRAEVYGVNDLAELTSEKAIREAGRMRVEGKNYAMADGDVCHFLFNV